MTPPQPYPEASLYATVFVAVDGVLVEKKLWTSKFEIQPKTDDARPDPDVGGAEP
jgi:hypothetical protein